MVKQKIVYRILGARSDDNICILLLLQQIVVYVINILYIYPCCLYAYITYTIYTMGIQSVATGYFGYNSLYTTPLA